MFVLPLLLLPALQGPPRFDEGPGLQESETCATCHSSSPRAAAMRDAAGRPIAPYDLWSGTMMANAARDPLWRAFVSAEIAATPSRRAEIETACLSCHAPMAHRAGLEEHDTGSLLHVLDCESGLGDVARDGVSCTICHGISPEGLGTEGSFSAGFVLDRTRRLYGPHEDPFTHPMRPFTGFTPTFGEHVLDSALCGSCHTLETETYDSSGEELGRFLEQAVYLEWRSSSYAAEDGVSCQHCHAPTIDEDGRKIRTTIARNPGGRDFPRTTAREPFGRHLFVGGNTLVTAILRDHRAELGVPASERALQATLDATRAQLEERTASVAVKSVRVDDGGLSFDVVVTNRTGHKLPTGHPTRRAWLRVEVVDADGDLVFASGLTDEEGRIVDRSGRPLPSEHVGGPVEPHRDVVRASDEVATYEAVPADASGDVTHTLLHAASWLVDDRLLPRGFDPDHPDARRVAPVGIGDDDDFSGGRDRVRYEIPLEGRGPFKLEVSLVYQTLSARWAAELFTVDTPEVRAFRRMFERADRAPVVLASDRRRL